MKSLLSVLAFSVLLNPSAKAMEPITTGLLVGTGLVATGALLSVTDGSGCLDGSALCVVGSYATAASPLVALSISIFGYVGMKEEIPQIKSDSVDFLAGFEKTILLEEAIEVLRSESQELAALSDEEIVATLSTISL